MNKAQITFLVLILALGFLVRLYRINFPIADWHSFRQSDTAAVSKIYVREGYDLLHPKYFDISNVQSGLDNPNGYRFVEFPIYNLLHAFFYKTFGLLTFETWGRLINIIASLFSGFIIFLLLRKYYNLKTAFLGLSFFLFIPFSIFYSRTILPDIMMTTASLGGIYFFDKFLDAKKKAKFVYYFLAIFFTASALLLKPFAIFFTIPMIFLAFKKYKKNTFFKWYLWIFAIFSLLPLLLWRNWISNFPEGIPASNWLFNGNGIRFRPSFFRWIFYERVTKLILGYSGVILLASSCLALKNRKIYFFIAFAISSLLYLFVIATGNVQHDYYQILILPTISIFAGIGSFELYTLLRKKVGNLFSTLILALLIFLALFFSLDQVKDYFNINDPRMVAAGRRADEILPKDAIVIAPYDGSTTFLNIISRKGWPVFQSPIEELIEKGAQYLVIASPTKNDFSGFGTQYEIVDLSSDYLILKLK